MILDETRQNARRARHEDAQRINLRDGGDASVTIMPNGSSRSADDAWDSK